ncbi:MAG TPA: ABC transporter substrate-binding protein [Xanthobacteraceae bacterium]|nr:ABC transporter substrate-binding protein [Xanthobacteraceae bacterium]
MVALGPDVIVGGIGPTAPVLQQATRAVPIVVAQSVDPVGGGFVDSLARPGGNLTGFIQFEYSLAGKWLELLKEIAPQVSRVGVVRELEGGPVGIGQWAVLQAFASPMGVELSPINLREGGETEHALSGFARGTSNGLIVAVGTQAAIQRELIVALAARHRLPAVYSNRFFVEAGGLLSYGANLTDNYRRAAGYVDRILRGAKPADLPVQAPTRYQLVINLVWSLRSQAPISRHSAVSSCQFLCSTAEPFLRPDLSSSGRRAQPASRLPVGHRRRRRAAALTVASTAPSFARSGGAVEVRLLAPYGFFGGARNDLSGAPMGRRISIAPQPCIRWILVDPNHDAVMRIGGMLRAAGPFSRAALKPWLMSGHRHSDRRQQAVSTAGRLPNFTNSALRDRGFKRSRAA